MIVPESSPFVSDGGLTNPSVNYWKMYAFGLSGIILIHISVWLKKKLHKVWIVMPAGVQFYN